MTFREYLLANMFDGYEDGTISGSTSKLLDDLQELYTSFQETRAPRSVAHPDF